MPVLTIEIARGLAALWVFLYHFEHWPAWPFSVALAERGHLGVPMFFVISGFCIGAAALKSRDEAEPAEHFLRRRMRRIYPPFWASIVVIVAAPFLVALISMAKSGEYHMPSPSWLSFGWADWLRVATLLQAFFSHGGHPESAFSPLYAPYWSLAIEVQFYIVVYLAIRTRAWLNGVLVAVTLVGVVSACFKSAYATGLFLAFWPMFALGLGLHRIMRRGWTPSGVFGRYAGIIAALAGALLLAALARLLATGTMRHLAATVPETLDFTFALMFSLFLWFSSQAEPALARWSKSGSTMSRALIAAAVGLGTISYSLYLLHGKIYQIPALFVRQVLPPFTPANGILTILLTIGLAWVFHRYVERRFISQRRAARAPALLPA